MKILLITTLLVVLSARGRDALPLCSIDATTGAVTCELRQSNGAYVNYSCPHTVLTAADLSVCTKL